MPDFQSALIRLRSYANKVPKALWIAGVIATISLGIVGWTTLSSPPYTVLSDGLSPADGGKIINQLQKLGIPYELQEAGNVILVPASQLAQARLQLGVSQIPGSSAQTAWNQLENAPITASDLAQSTMADQALELSLEQSIEALNGIRNAQVFLAQPPQTPFLSDQPKATASVVIDANQSQAIAQASSIAAMVAGAVPGLAQANVTVITTAGITVYPADDSMNSGTQFTILEQIQNNAAARVADLLTPMVGAGNFRTDVSANMDFTQVQIHQISYGPNHIIQSSTENKSTKTGDIDSGYGIPGALSNEPPGQTTTTTSTDNTNAENNSASTPTTTNPAQKQTPEKPILPSQTDSDIQQNFLTDQTNSNILKPSWTVKSLAISIVLNENSLPKNLSIEQIKTAIAGGFAYPDVKVNILSAPFSRPIENHYGMPILAASMGPVIHSLLELLCAFALLFGLALPVGRRLAGINYKSLLSPQRPALPNPVAITTPKYDFTELREHAAENIPGVAQLLQGWVNENE